MNPNDQIRRNQFLELLRKPQRYTAEDLDKLRSDMEVLGQYDERTHAIAQGRISIELLDAIRRFDDSSGTLVNTTNTLTKKILRLTWTSLVISVISLIVAGIALFR